MARRSSKAVAPANIREMVGGLEPDEGLVNLRAVVQETQDRSVEIEELEAELDKKKSELNDLLMRKLPDLFLELGVKNMEIEASGTRPAFVLELRDYYRASIPKDRENEAHTWLTDNGHGDLIKTVFKIEFGLDEHDEAVTFDRELADAGIEFESRVQVPHPTLTAFVKAECLEGRKGDLPLELLGAQVGQIVKIKVDKEKS